MLVSRRPLKRKVELSLEQTLERQRQLAYLRIPELFGLAFRADAPLAGHGRDPARSRISPGVPGPATTGRHSPQVAVLVEQPLEAQVGHQGAATARSLCSVKTQPGRG